MTEPAPIPDATTEVALAVRALLPGLRRQAILATTIITLAITGAGVAAVPVSYTHLTLPTSDLV